jgi:lipooligosaccharide transport system permease protein
MSEVFANWQGASKLVDPAKPARWGSVYVALARGRESLKWLTPMLAYGIGHPILYLLSIGIGLGSLVSENMGLVDGVAYLTFLAPALLMASALQAAVDETSFVVLQGFSWEKSFFAMNQTAITGRQIASGLMIYAVFRVFYNSVIYAIFLVLFGAMDIAAVPMQILIAMLVGGSFGFVMLAYSAHVKDEGDWLVLMMRFVIAPMFMFSGTFYQIETMPELVQQIAWVSPLWHGTELARTLSYGSSDPYTLWHIVIILGIGALGASFAYPRFMKRLSR